MEGRAGLEPAPDGLTDRCLDHFSFLPMCKDLPDDPVPLHAKIASVDVLDRLTETRENTFRLPPRFNGGVVEVKPIRHHFVFVQDENHGVERQPVCVDQRERVPHNPQAFRGDVITELATSNET